MTRSNVAERLARAVSTAPPQCPSLQGRVISPHTLSHTTAMHLLQAGVDLTVIALWLGHESPVTTLCYVEADLAMKERALATIAPSGTCGTLLADRCTVEVPASPLIMRSRPEQGAADRAGSCRRVNIIAD